MAEETKATEVEVKEGLCTKAGKVADKMFGGLGNWGKKHWKILLGTVVGAGVATGTGFYIGKKKSENDIIGNAIDMDVTIDADSAVNEAPTDSDVANDSEE